MATREDLKKRRLTMSRMVANGSTVEQVAKMYGLTICSVRMACRENDVSYPLLERGRKPSSILHQRNFTIIANLQDCELTYKQIGAIHNISRERVRQVRAEAVEAGLAMPDRSCKPNAKIVTACKECGKVLVSDCGVGKIHCSTMCLNKTTIRRNSFICNQCGDIFVMTINNRKRYFCSSECWYVHLGIHGRVEHKQIPAKVLAGG